MKKLFTLVFLLGTALTSFAQTKIYVTMMVEEFGNYYDYGFDEIYLSGSLPTTVKNHYKSSDKKCSGDIITLLTKAGFTIEQMSGKGTSGLFYLFSKSGSSSSAKIDTVQSDPDEEVTEVARYNLQGIPVKESDKGVQIIVYSNYTTKTVVVE